VVMAEEGWTVGGKEGGTGIGGGGDDEPLDW